MLVLKATPILTDLFSSSLDWVVKKFGPVRIDVIGKIAEAVLGGLTYLYSKHKIVGRHDV